MDETILRGLRLIRVLGEGAQGRVFLAESATGIVAVKAACDRLEPDSRDARAAADCRILHPNVVATLAVGTCAVDGRAAACVVMEYVDGGSLADLLRTDGPLPEPFVRRMATGLLRGLAAIHARGFVHGDIKPSNVLLRRDGTPRIADLGSAQAAPARREAATDAGLSGSPAWAAPERTAGRPRHDARADLFSLGVLLYESIAGVHPFAADSSDAAVRKVAHEEAPPLTATLPRASAFFAEFVATLLAKDPSRRFSTAATAERVLAQGESGAWWRRRSRGRPHAAPGARPIHGRDVELAVLFAALHHTTSAAEGRVVVVEAPAGAGKSTLVRDFAARLAASASPPRVVEIRPRDADSGEDGDFARILRALLGSDPTAALRDALEAIPFRRDEVARHLAGEAAPPSADSAVAIWTALARWSSSRAPLVVVAEDQHDSGPVMEQAVLALARAAERLRVLVVATFRPEGRVRCASLAALPHAVTVGLRPLGTDAVEALLRAELGSAHTAARLAPRVVAVTGGNAYFVAECARAMRGAGPDSPVPVPGGLREVIAARMTALAPEDLGILRLAACAGRAADAGVVAAASGRGHVEVLRALARLADDTDFVRATGLRVEFAHELVREVLLAATPPADLRECHAAITRELVARRAPRRDVVRHAIAACAVGTVREHLHAALQDALTSESWDDVMALADGALGLDGAVADAERGRVLDARQTAVRYVRPVAEGRRAAEEYVAWARLNAEPRELASALTHLASTALSQNDRAGVEPVLSEALALAVAAGDASVEVAARVMLAQVRELSRDPSGAEAAYRGALRRARETGSGRAARQCLAGLAVIARLRGDAAGALRLRGEILDGALEDGSHVEVTTAEVNLAGALLLAGDSEAARLRFAAAAANARAGGLLRLEASVLGNLAILEMDAGRYAAAGPLVERYVGVAHDIAQPWAIAHADGHLAGLALRIGRAAEAASIARRMLDRAAILGDARLQCSACLILSEALHELGDAPGATSMARDAESLAARTGDLALAAEALSLQWTGTSAASHTTLDSLARRHLAAARAAGSADSAALALARLAELGGVPIDEASAASRDVGPGCDPVARIAILAQLHRAGSGPQSVRDAASELDRLVSRAAPPDRDGVRGRRVHRYVRDMAANAFGP